MCLSPCVSPVGGGGGGGGGGGWLLVRMAYPYMPPNKGEQPGHDEPADLDRGGEAMEGDDGGG